MQIAIDINNQVSFKANEYKTVEQQEKDEQNVIKYRQFNH